MSNGDWRIFTGCGQPHDGIEALRDTQPPWRTFHGHVSRERKFPERDEDLPVRDVECGRKFRLNDDMIEMVNAALYLRRPLLVTGKPGTGKSSLIHAVAYELKLGRVLKWPVTSKSTLKDALYQYDALGRLQAQQAESRSFDIGGFLKLGPLGTALLPTDRPRALLIDEIDKSDIDLPNDLLNIFEEGEFRIPELARLRREDPVEIGTDTEDETFPILNGHVQCRQFPFVVLTSNGERDFPPAFLRRCLRLEMPTPKKPELAEIVKAHLGESLASRADHLIGEFCTRNESGKLATDQLLNAVFMVLGNDAFTDELRRKLTDALMRELTSA